MSNEATPEIQTRRGLVLYPSNPFVSLAATNTKQRTRRRIVNGNSMMLTNDGSGELVTGGFWQAEEVDASKFVKLYIGGVKAFKDLSSAGTKVFEVLYNEVQNGIGRDKVFLSFAMVNQVSTPMSVATYTRGMKELMIKKFLAPSEITCIYWLNPDYMWNGDRLAFVKEYRKVSSTPRAKDTLTSDMFTDSSQVIT
jgi:hypothetical protein